MRTQDAVDEGDGAYLASLRRLLVAPGYTADVREAAFVRLEVADPDGLRQVLRTALPGMGAWEGRTRLCSLIGDRGWTDMTPTLALAWAQPVGFFSREWERPEARALAAIHGEAQVVEVLLAELRQDRSAREQAYRARLWELLHRLGERERLVAMLNDTDAGTEDLFLLDLRAGLLVLGVMPANREEILWLRRLREPEHRAFWESAREALAALPRAERAALAMRDVPIVVAAARHMPELLARSTGELFDELAGSLRGQRFHSRTSNFDNVNPDQRERLRDHARVLTRGDLMAMLIARRALETRAVTDHLFDFAERDRRDRTTEYGGLIRLDDRGRFEIVEYPPRLREHDRKFNAAPEMIDAGYTALFHLHFHAQKHDNAEYAGPGFGDFQYAEAIGAHCLVATFIDAQRLNVDWYRAGRIMVDLGEIVGAPAAAPR